MTMDMYQKKYLLLVLFQHAYYRVSCGGNAVLPSREGCAVSNSILGGIIIIKLHCLGDSTHGSEEQEQWDVKIKCAVASATANACLWTHLSD